MKKILFAFLIMLATSQLLKAQDTVPAWKIGGLSALNFNQVSLTNWAAGGQSSVAGTALFNLTANYKKGKNAWDNVLNLAYGKNFQNMGKKEWDEIKSEDKIDFTSKYGRAASDKLFMTFLINFRSQFDKGYKIIDDSTSLVISKFMAPGYLTISAGIDFKPAEGFSIYASPVTGKVTFVMDKTLSDAGAFGVDSGSMVRNEFGGFIKAAVNKTIMENVTLQSSIDLFSNYLDKPGNIDVNWQVLIGMKINKYLTASISTQLIYDDNIKVTDKDYAKTQFKEAFALGISYQF
ncbi:MAG: DUF3078 domain-containing protein [Bacteroidales bacterium]